MPKVLIVIESCAECGYLNRGMSYSLDGFDRGSDWICKKSNKIICQFVESEAEGKRFGIPESCELRVN